MRTTNERRFRQQLYRGHTDLGILLSLFMYISLFFGLFAIFMPYLKTWEKPSRHFSPRDISRIDYEPMLANVLADPDFPRNGIRIDLPGFKKDPAVRISHQFAGEAVFNPVTGGKVRDEGNRSDLAMFLNGMHYGRPLKKLGLVLFGIITPGVLFLMAGGILLILTIRYRNRGKTRQSLYAKWHRKLLTWTCAPLALIVICGSVMGLSFDGIAPMTYILTHGKTANMGALVGPVLFPEPAVMSPANRTADMIPLSRLIQKAEQIAPEIHFQRLTLENWGDENAQVRIEGYHPGRPFLNGVTNRPTLVLMGSDGSLIDQRHVTDRSWGVLLTEAVYFLHLLFGVGIFTRFAVFAAMIATCLGIGFGVLLWLKKRERRFQGIPFYHWLAKFALAVMVGVIPATGLFIVLHWLLPFDLPDRLTWHQGLFFDAWLAALAWSFYRISSRQAAKEFLVSGGALFLAAPVLHWIHTGLGPLALIQNRMNNILCVDLCLALAGAAFLYAGTRLHRNGSKIWLRPIHPNNTDIRINHEYKNIALGSLFLALPVRGRRPYPASRDHGQ